MKKIDKIIDKYFKDEKTLYFTPADTINLGNHFLFCVRHQDTLELWIGCDESGNVPLAIFNDKDADKLDQLIKLIIY